MSKVHVKTGDTVILLTGDQKDRGKKGKVLQVAPKEGKVIVEGLNIVSKHVKPKKAGDASGIIKTEGAVYASKVMLVCPKCGKPTRIAHKIYADGTKERMCKKCGETF
ncbi:MAG: 50S ribosomal protein L24 [Oscillospiraceae bacterium]|nr:50S ribosomal protein L24 [Candidatus Equicaccousia limihippi]